MLDRDAGKKMSVLSDALPKTWGSPTMSPHCADEVKYAIVDKITSQYKDAAAAGGKVEKLELLITGARATVKKMRKQDLADLADKKA